MLPTMRIVVAPDSFKGSLSAADVAEAMTAGVARVLPDAEIVLRPVADGGEGTVAAAIWAGYRPEKLWVSGPDGARWRPRSRCGPTRPWWSWPPQRVWDWRRPLR